MPQNSPTKKGWITGQPNVEFCQGSENGSDRFGTINKKGKLMTQIMDNWNEEAKTAANLAAKCFPARRLGMMTPADLCNPRLWDAPPPRGVSMLRSAYGTTIIFGTDADRQDEGSVRRVMSIRRRLQSAGFEELGFGVSEDTNRGSWAIIVATDDAGAVRRALEAKGTGGDATVAA